MADFIIEPVQLGHGVIGKRYLNPKAVAYMIEIVNANGEVSGAASLISGETISLTSKGWLELKHALKFDEPKTPVDKLWYAEWGDMPPDNTLTEDDD